MEQAFQSWVAGAKTGMNDFVTTLPDGADFEMSLSDIGKMATQSAAAAAAAPSVTDGASHGGSWWVSNCIDFSSETTVFSTENLNCFNPAHFNSMPMMGAAILGVIILIVVYRCMYARRHPKAAAGSSGQTCSKHTTSSDYKVVGGAHMSLMNRVKLFILTKLRNMLYFWLLIYGSILVRLTNLCKWLDAKIAECQHPHPVKATS